MSAGALHLVVPQGVDAPQRASGGNTYDRRLRAALRDAGWAVDVVEVEGGWPWSASVGAGDLERALRGLPDGALVLVDGLLASRLPEVMVPASRRLRVVLLVHLPVGVDDEGARTAERQVVAAAASVVTPSRWCRDWLVREYDCDPGGGAGAQPRGGGGPPGRPRRWSRGGGGAGWGGGGRTPAPRAPCPAPIPGSTRPPSSLRRAGSARC